MAFARTNSQRTGLRTADRARYLWRLLRLYLHDRFHPGPLTWLADDVATYRTLLARWTGRSLDDARILEIGPGQRPYRLTTLHSLGLNVVGIDLDRILLRVTPAELVLLFGNGALRAVKTLVRRFCFDTHEYRRLRRFLRREMGATMRLPVGRVRCGNAAAPACWTDGPFDFIFSEDVFEHVPAGDMPALIDRMAENLSPDGLAVITPLIFSGVSGGHDLGWYTREAKLFADRRAAPWGHLLGEADEPDTYLNQLLRRDYRAMFSARFEIAEEIDVERDWGQELLTPAVRERLKDFTDEDLMSNHVRFVLRHPPAKRPAR